MGKPTTETTTRLLERLRATSGSCGDRHTMLNNPDGPAAAAEIERLRGALAEMTDYIRRRHNYGARRREEIRLDLLRRHV